MYAVIEDRGRQHRVSEGETILVDLMDGEAGAELTFDRVLLLGPSSDAASSGGVQVGTPYVDGAKVIARLIDAVKGEKVVSYKYKRRKGYHRKKGHRQKYSRVTIESIRA